MLKIVPSRRDSRAAVAGDVELLIAALCATATSKGLGWPRAPPGLRRDRHWAGTSTAGSPWHTAHRGPAPPVPKAGLFPAHLASLPNRGRNGKGPPGKSSAKRCNLIKLTRSCTPLEMTNDIYKHGTNTRQSIHLPLSLQSVVPSSWNHFCTSSVPKPVCLSRHAGMAENIKQNTGKGVHVLCAALFEVLGLEEGEMAGRSPSTCLAPAHCPHLKGSASSPPAQSCPNWATTPFWGRRSAKPLQWTNPVQESPHFVHFSLLAARYFLSTPFLVAAAPLQPS